MTLSRLGRSEKDEVAAEQVVSDTQNKLLDQIKRLNDYMALMTDEPSPPTEHDDTDATT